MEGVGARLGRSSTRYGPTTVFSGPVRKWKKKWVHVSASSNAANHTPSSNGNNGNNGSHLLLYKWTSNNNNNGDNKGSVKGDDSPVTPVRSPPRKKFRYVPIAVIEEQKREAEEKVDDEAKPSEADPSTATTSKSDGSDGKPDINDVPMEEAQALDDGQSAPREMNETSLDLSLGLKSRDREPNAKSEDPKNGGQL